MIFPLLFFLAAPKSTADLDSSLKRFTEVLATVQREAADPVITETAIYQGAIPGMLRRLDPHSIFFDPQQYEQLKEMERSERKGFGTVVSILPGRVIVLFRSMSSSRKWRGRSARASVPWCPFCRGASLCSRRWWVHRPPKRDCSLAMRSWLSITLRWRGWSSSK